MTEEQIERAVERKFNSLDARFMSATNDMTQSTYDAASKAIHDWAEIEYQRVDRAPTDCRYVGSAERG